jgi:hypothetical protein
LDHADCTRAASRERLTAVKSSALQSTSIDWFQLGAGCISAISAVWQRLLFDRLLPVPPLVLALSFWILLASSLALHHVSAVPARRAAAWLTLAALLWHVGFVGLPTFDSGVGLEEYRWKLAGFLGASWYGVPYNALLIAAGVLTWSWLCTQSAKLPGLGLCAGVVVLLFGATTVLGYATGSPWPFGV